MPQRMRASDGWAITIAATLRVNRNFAEGG